MSEQGLRSFQKNKVNPFLEKAIEEVNKGIVKKFKSSSGQDQKAVLQAIDPNTGEVLGHTTFIRQIEVDEEIFAKIYISQFAHFWELGKQAIKVFGYIMTQLKPGQDMFIFLLDDCMKYTQYKNHRSIHQGLTDLLKSDIIARGPSEVLYFINPLVVFNGNRVSYVKSYVKRKKESDNQLNMFDNIKIDAFDRD